MCCCFADAAGADDADFIHAVLYFMRQVAAHNPIDEARIQKAAV
jgi:hypothetical protein